MDMLLAKIFATALVFSQVATAPSELRTKFDEIHDQSAVSELLRAGCAHMRKAFDVEDFNLDDLIATAMEDVDALSSDQVILRGINIKQLHVAYRQFCKNENVSDSPVDLAEVIRFYNDTLADLPSSIDLTELKPPGMTAVIDSTGGQFHQRRTWISYRANSPSCSASVCRRRRQAVLRAQRDRRSCAGARVHCKFRPARTIAGRLNDHPAGGEESSCRRGGRLRA